MSCAAGRFSRLGRWLARLARRCVSWRYFNRTVAMRESSAAREGLKDLIDWWGDARNLTMVEIGSYSGESAELFLASGKISKIYCMSAFFICKKRFIFFFSVPNTYNFRFVIWIKDFFNSLCQRFNCTSWSFLHKNITTDSMFKRKKNQTYCLF